MFLIDYTSVLDRPSLSAEDRATVKRMMAKCEAWAKEHPDCAPRIPHFKHVCMDPHCTREHDPYPLLVV